MATTVFDKPFNVGVASQSENGLMSSTDKTKLDGIATGANKITKVSELANDSGFTTNTGTITGITMNGVSKGTSGVVDLGTVITSHQDISGKVSVNSVAQLSALEIGAGAYGHGGYIDFHYNGDYTVDHTSRIIEGAYGEIFINGISIPGLNSGKAPISRLTQNCNQSSVADVQSALLSVWNGMSDNSVSFGYASVPSDATTGLNGGKGLVLYARNTAGTYIAVFLLGGTRIVTDYYYSSAHHWSHN